MFNDPFESADYYDAIESDCVTCMHPHDAIDEYVQFHLCWDEQPCPVVVAAYVTETSDKDIASIAFDVASRATDHLDDLLYEFDETERHDRLESSKGLLLAIEAATMRVLREHADLRTLRKVGERTYSVDEVRKIIGEP